MGNLGGNEKLLAKAIMFDKGMDAFLESREKITNEFKKFKEAGNTAVIIGAKEPSELLKTLSTFMTQEHLTLLELIEATEKAEGEIKNA